MRRNKLFILGLFFAFVAVLSLTLVSGTWAKYTTTKSASSTAKVAKWEWAYTGTNSSGTEFAFNLFDTILDTKNDGSSETPNYDEEDVATSESAKIIAPGTKGEATIKVQNKSEVDATAVITFTITNIGTSGDKIPLKFWVSVQNGTATAVKTEITTQAEAGTYTVTLGELGELEVGSLEQTVILSWEWTFEGVNDSYDTQLGQKAAESLINTTVTATIEFTQVD